MAIIGEHLRARLSVAELLELIPSLSHRLSRAAGTHVVGDQPGACPDRAGKPVRHGRGLA